MSRAPAATIAACAGLALLAALVAGCRREGQAAAGRGAAEPAATAAAPVTVSYAYWALDTDEVKLIGELARRFEAREPTIRVRLIEAPQRYYDKLKTLMAAGQPPDVFSANYGRLADLVRLGAVADLRHLIGDERDIAGGYAPGLWGAGVAGMARALGRPGVWGLPRDWPPAGLLAYNRDLLRAAGAPQPDGRWSWDGFRQACEQVAQARLPGVAAAAAVNLYPYSVFTWLAQADAPVFGPGGEALPQRAHAAEAVGYVLGLWHDGLATRPNPREDDSMEEFRAGRVAFCFTTYYGLRQCAKTPGLDWGVASPLRHRRQACSSLPTFLALSSACAHPDAALRWATFLSQAAAGDYAARELSVPAARSGLADRVFLARPPLDRARRAVIEGMRVSQPPPVHPTAPYEQVIEEMRRALETAIAGRASVADALAEAARRIEAAAGTPPPASADG